MSLVHTAASTRLPRLAASASLRVWLLRTERWQSHWPALQQHVDVAQRRRFAAMRDPLRRQERLLAHALHRVVLADALSLPPGELPLYRTPAGQPRLALADLCTSLSHADGIVAIALASGPVGVDVELRATRSLRPIADLVCTPAELCGTGRAPIDEAGLLELWVRKEAALKAAGLGLSRPMASFEAPDGARLSLRDAQGARVAMDVQMIRGLAGCVVAVAGPPGLHPQWQWLHPQD